MGFRRLGFRTLLFALLWWMLTEGAMNSWLVGAPVVLLAVLASEALLPGYSWSLTGFVRFIPFFLWRSLYGGVDVARRALDTNMPIAPDLVEYPLRLPPGLPQLFMANTVSLLPGTLSVVLDRDVLNVHVLDKRKDFMTELEAVERRVAALFGALLPVRTGGE